jgi:hypothetical protein
VLWTEETKRSLDAGERARPGRERAPVFQGPTRAAAYDDLCGRRFRRSTETCQSFSLTKNWTLRRPNTTQRASSRCVCVAKLRLHTVGTVRCLNEPQSSWDASTTTPSRRLAASGRGEPVMLLPGCRSVRTAAATSPRHYRVADISSCMLRPVAIPVAWRAWARFLCAGSPITTR